MPKVAGEVAAPGVIAARLQKTMARANALRVPSRSVSRPATSMAIAYPALEGAGHLPILGAVEMQDSLQRLLQHRENVAIDIGNHRRKEQESANHPSHVRGGRFGDACVRHDEHLIIGEPRPPANPTLAACPRLSTSRAGTATPTQIPHNHPYRGTLRLSFGDLRPATISAKFRRSRRFALEVVSDNRPKNTQAVASIRTLRWRAHRIPTPPCARKCFLISHFL